MRATLDALARFGDGLLTLATAVEGLAGRLRLRLRLRGAGLGVRLRTDLCTSKKQPEKQSDARLPQSCRRRCKIPGGPRPAAGPGRAAVSATSPQGVKYALKRSVSAW